jgi:hypothetical protein
MQCMGFMLVRYRPNPASLSGYIVSILKLVLVLYSLCYFRVMESIINAASKGQLNSPVPVASTTGQRLINRITCQAPTPSHK